MITIWVYGGALLPFLIVWGFCQVWNWPAGIGFPSDDDWQVAKPMLGLQVLVAGAFVLLAGLSGLMAFQSHSIGDLILTVCLTAPLLIPLCWFLVGIWGRRVRWNKHGIEDCRLFGRCHVTAWSEVKEAGVPVMGASIYWSSLSGSQKMSLVFRPSREFYLACKHHLGNRFRDQGEAYRFLGLPKN
ncbi:MAG: hypothetical protein NXI03_03435 [Alphaproteobacteria bacterium]|uniref:hypothetical protein n=1 Tax=Maricaulis alexandrii TaxID=2570354 RepID=UPI0011081241|nr:hypothetical protein [Maricaulis alexandrii]MCR9266599.1 hypothetical protein [Alphaproteobacteria bacterium]